MNQLLISLFITGAVSVLVFIVLLLIAITLQFRKKHSWFHLSMYGFLGNFKKQLLHAEVRAQEAVFRLIAREIHDNIGLTLTTIKLFLHRLHPGRNTEEANCLNGSKRMLGKVIEQLRHICRSMNGDVLEDQGLVNALQQEIERLNELNHLRIQLRVEGEQVNFESSRELVVLRMIQESLNNIIKHAKAKVAVINLTFTNNRLEIEVRDDGIGISSTQESKTKGTGMINLFKRAEMLQGCCTVSNNTPSGTTIAISIPINQ